MLVLVDTSVWIDYFRSGHQSAELIPFLKLKHHVKVIQLLSEIKRIPLKIDWGGIIESQWLCLKSGSNGIGIPDLIIAQNATENSCEVFSLDKHFLMLSQVLGVKLYQTQNLSP